MRPLQLAHLLNSYPDKDYIINGFNEGFSLDFAGSQSSLLSTNSLSVTQNPSTTLQKINYEVGLGRICGPFPSPPFENFKVFPLALREKSVPGKFRLLHNLSFPYNDESLSLNIPRECSSVKYETLTDAIFLINSFESPWLAKADISEAFRLIPLHPSQYNLTGFYFRDFYYDRCLPMGCSSSCKIFERFSSALKWILRTRYNVCHVVKVLDDFLFVGSTRAECKYSLESFFELCRLINVPIAHQKTEGPTKTLVFLGIELDITSMVARLPKEKLENYAGLVGQFLASPSCSLTEMRSLVGKLQFATSVVSAGRPFLRRLYDSTIGLTDKTSRVYLGKNVKADLKIWSLFLSGYNGVTLIKHSSLSCNDIHFHSDSSKTFGGVFQQNYICGLFPSSWQKKDIQVLEFFPIYLLVAIFRKYLGNKQVLFHCDNASVVASINKQSSKNKEVMAIMRPFILILLNDNITFKAVHLPGKQNSLCDKISRQQVTAELLRSHGMNLSPTHIPHRLRPQNLTLKSDAAL